MVKQEPTSLLGPFLTKGHPLQSGRPASSLKTEQIADLANFLHQKVYNTLRSGPELQIQNVLTGDNLLIGGFIVTGNDVKKVLLMPDNDYKWLSDVAWRAWNDALFVRR